MSWIDETVRAKKNPVAKAKAEADKKRRFRRKRARQHATKYQSEFKRLNPMVQRLLRDVGNAWWGRFLLFPKYKISIYRHSNTCWSWEILGKHADGGGSNVGWYVTLNDKYSDERDYYFHVSPFYFSSHPSDNKSIATLDTSEDELKKALKSAVSLGPGLFDSMRGMGYSAG